MSDAKVRVPDLRERKRRGEKIAVLTAYDATMARLLDRAGVDVLLVGDSVGVVVLGHEHTLPVTLDDMLHHTRAVARGTSRALIVADMPFMSYQVSVEEAVRNAGRLLQAGAAAVKVEGGPAIAGAVRRMVEVGIPVMGHRGCSRSRFIRWAATAGKPCSARRSRRSWKTRTRSNGRARLRSCSKRSETTRRGA